MDLRSSKSTWTDGTTILYVYRVPYQLLSQPAGELIVLSSSFSPSEKFKELVYSLTAREQMLHVISGRAPCSCVSHLMSCRHLQLERSHPLARAGFHATLRCASKFGSQQRHLCRSNPRTVVIHRNPKERDLKA